MSRGKWRTTVQATKRPGVCDHLAVVGFVYDPGVETGWSTNSLVRLADWSVGLRHSGMKLSRLSDFLVMANAQIYQNARRTVCSGVKLPRAQLCMHYLS